MIERVVILENVDPVIFYGVNDSNIQLLRTLFPKLRILARGLVVKAIGDEVEMAIFEEKITELMRYCAEYNLLSEEAVIDIVKGNRPPEVKKDNLIIHGVNGRPIVARSENQKLLVKAFEENDLVFALGPAGSGKTYVAIALAVRAMKNKEVKKIILSRPAVEAGEKLGFLPGDMQEKVNPYLRPLFDGLLDMFGPEEFMRLQQKGQIEVAPLAYMRGRTLEKSFVILDEAQNTTVEQIKMFLTRLGFRSKMVINGDVTQIDLPPHVKSGLIDALRVLGGVKDIGQVHFTEDDVVRHDLVAAIIHAYEEDARKRNKNGGSSHGNHD